jgi:hypothetical protein
MAVSKLRNGHPKPRNDVLQVSNWPFEVAGHAVSLRNVFGLIVFLPLAPIAQLAEQLTLNEATGFPVASVVFRPSRVTSLLVET